MPFQSLFLTLKSALPAEKKPFHKAVTPVTDYEIVDPNDPNLEAAGTCCICDDPGTTECSAESTHGTYYTTAGAQFFAYWGMGR